ncbi:MAG: type II toxin-antitoxin system HicB family antitoxin [Endomicrobia bacterium]|nr:type II toxin-antitoxin system HicB family antitoxin [Endomicrobiia bacterium]MDW8056509.1 type II toxin-antitoxin system HicB family antitoxin [Elusimicrobiota bacterium]
MVYKFSAVLEKEGKYYTALCPELDIASQGKTVEEAIENLKEAVELFLECASKKEISERMTGRSPLVTTIEVKK